MPDKPSPNGLEAKWDAVWQRERPYRYDRSKARDETYAIDTPPPTISGDLHLGTAFGYIQVDAIARFQRMRGRAVFYPMGWDDNGLPTERRVQSHYGVRCDPTLPYQPDLALTGRPEDPQRVSRPNFVELCERLTAEFEDDFERQWRAMGLSVDWSLTYATIDARARRAAQLAFLRNLQRGEAYASDAPTMWDVDFQTAVAQAEVEDRPVRGAYYRLAFPRPDGGGSGGLRSEAGTQAAGGHAQPSGSPPVDKGSGGLESEAATQAAGGHAQPSGSPPVDQAPVEVETTRPELLASCVALVVHPDDERHRALVGTEVATPLFGVRVPVVAHRLAEPGKGTGAAMVCTFGDATDVVWWRELDLPTRSVIRRDGRMAEEPPPGIPAGPPTEA
ncbi:MAG TPA: class I tRNA ligase family protein, partial [Actinomycetes bacterium]